MKPIETWILVADGARARMFRNSGPGRGMHAIEGMEFHGDHSATHEIVSDRQGRSYSSHGPGRSAIEGHSDPHRELKKTFAHSLADVLAKNLTQKAFDRLIIAAPPAALGDLRAALSDKVRATVTAEIAHDLTKTRTNDLAKHFENVLLL